MNLLNTYGEFNRILLTVEYIKSGDFPLIFSEEGQFAGADFEIIENYFSVQNFTNQVLDEMKNLKACKLNTWGRVWEIASLSKSKKVYIFNIEFDDSQAKINLEDARLNLEKIIVDSDDFEYQKGEDSTFFVHDLNLIPDC